MDDDHTGALAKPTAGPVLLLWSLEIPLIHSVLHSHDITALTEYKGVVGERGISPLQYSTVLCAYLSIFWP